MLLLLAVYGMFDGPLVPDAAIRQFVLADPTLDIELVAAEPQLDSPVAVAWDAAGRMFAAEMRDYPAADGGGAIRLLSEPDDKGRYRKSTVFADKLPFPNGVLPFRDGVLVTAAPDIWFMRDTNGDGVADERTKVLTGFAAGNQQLRVNGLHFAMDGWIYGSNGRNGGSVRRPSDPPSKAVSLARNDFRFHPSDFRIEAVGGFGQFGMAHDDWGNRFPSWNTAPLRQVLVEDRHLASAPPTAGGGVVDLIDPADSGRLFPIAPRPSTFNRESVQHFNASCGNHIYRGDAMPKLAGQFFVCEPLLNLVHRRVLEPRGGAFTAKRIDTDKEFLASRDPWFHPVNLATGPDGALYVVDFYRKWVEHPQFVPEKLRGTEDWRVGHSHGRIWRIRPRGGPLPTAPNLDKHSDAKLVAEIGHPNGWRRDTAQRLLIESGAKDIVPVLCHAVFNGKQLPGRVQALWTLACLNECDDATLWNALLDTPEEKLCAAAARIAEGRLGKREIADAMQAAAARYGSVSLTPVLLRLAEAKRFAAVAKYAARFPDDPGVRLATAAAIGAGPLEMLDALANDPESVSPNRIQTLRALGEALALANAPNAPAKLSEFAKRHSTAPSVFGLLAGWASGYRRVHPHAPLQNVEISDDGWMLARAVAVDSKQQAPTRLAAMQALAAFRPDRSQWMLRTLGERVTPTEMLGDWAAALADVGSPATIAGLLGDWSTLPVANRRAFVASLVQRPRTAAMLLDALDSKRLTAIEFDAEARAALARSKDDAVKKRAAARFSAPTSNRRSVIDKYADYPVLGPRARNGSTYFARLCSACHRRGGQGHDVGPDLSGLDAKPTETLRTDVLDPNREVAPDFIAYIAVLQDGRTVEGLLAAETPSAVTLRKSQGVRETLLRSEIVELRATGRSLMPEGFEKDLSPQALADLIAYLQGPVEAANPLR